MGECRTSTDAEGSVCGIANDCYEGHTGLICGCCMREYTRDAFPAPCEPCSAMPETSVLVIQLIGDLTMGALWNEFLAISALAKTETQKNILTVLLRMYTHWAAQVGVLSQFNLSKVEKMEWGQKGED